MLNAYHTKACPTLVIGLIMGASLLVQTSVVTPQNRSMHMPCRILHVLSACSCTSRNDLPLLVHTTCLSEKCWPRVKLIRSATAGELPPTPPPTPPTPPPPGTPTDPPPPPGSCAEAYGQCGGSGHSGPTCCAEGFECAEQNVHYSQCLPVRPLLPQSTTTLIAFDNFSNTSLSRQLSPALSRLIAFALECLESESNEPPGVGGAPAFSFLYC